MLLVNLIGYWASIRLLPRVSEYIKEPFSTPINIPFLLNPLLNDNEKNHYLSSSIPYPKWEYSWKSALKFDLIAPNNGFTEANLVSRLIDDQCFSYAL